MRVRSKSVLGALIAVAGCASAPADPQLPAMHAGDRPRGRDEAVVALYNGEPLTWRSVAEKALELDPKSAVDTYVRWRVADDRRAELRITNSAEELRLRAKAYVDDARRRLGPEGFAAQLKAEGSTEADYASRLAGSDYLSQLLTLDKIVRYQAVVDGALVVDRALFPDEASARAFAEAARSKGFDAAPLASGARRWLRETFARSAPPVDPPLDLPGLELAQAGSVLGPDRHRSGAFTVARLVERREPRRVAYGEVASELFQGILSRPPEPGEYRAWLTKALGEARVEYAAPKTERTK
jgi:hypothetical protein